MYKTHAMEIIIKRSITTWRKTLLVNSRLAAGVREELENYIAAFDIYVQFVPIHREKKSLRQYTFFLLVVANVSRHTD